MTQATYVLYRKTILLPSIRLWDIAKYLVSLLFPRKLVALGRVLLLVGLLIPFSMVVGVLPASFGLLALAFVGVASGSMACLIGSTCYVGWNQELY